jgi:hypothetical protein
VFLLDFLLEGGLVGVLLPLLLLDGPAGRWTQAGAGFDGKRPRHETLEIRSPARAADRIVPLTHERFEPSAAGTAAEVVQRHANPSSLIQGSDDEG